MLLVHARVLAPEEVARLGVNYPKNGPFTDEQLGADDWEPVYPPLPAPTGDCGCDEK